MQPSIQPLFVYGSLRSGFQHPAYAYISRHFTLLGTAKVHGVLYDMGDYPAALPTDTNKWIIGELYTINDPAEFSWAIAQLDDYEGLNVEEGETPLYTRATSTVYLPDHTVQAWIYWFNGDVSGKPVIDCGDLLEYLQQKNKS